MEGFRYGLNDEIGFLLPKGDTSWTLEEYISFALWVDGSSVTVGETVKIPSPSSSPTLHPSPQQIPSPPSHVPHRAEKGCHSPPNIESLSLPLLPPLPKTASLLAPPLLALYSPSYSPLFTLPCNSYPSWVLWSPALTFKMEFLA